MAEDTKNAEVEEEVDPWDFDDPESVNVEPVSEDIPAESEEATEEPQDDPAEEIVIRAKDAGLTQDDMDNMGSKDTLKFVLDLLENKTKEIKEEVRNTASDGDAAKSESSEPSTDEFSWIDDLDPDEAVDSDAIKALKAMKTKLDDMTSEVGQMAKSRNEAKVASFFAQLDENWNEIFGTGEKATSKMEANRHTVIEEMEALREGYRSRKKRIPEDNELFERALRSTFGEHEQNFARKEITEKLAKRENQFLSRAQSRPGKELLTGREKAVSSVAARMRELGLSGLDDISDTFE